MKFTTLSSGATLSLLAAVGTLVLLLYLLKSKPRRVPVSSILIWRRVLRTRRSSSDRFRWWVSLLLAAAVAFALALGLARPQSGWFGFAQERVVLVLDNSMTLATLTADGRTRWDHAIERAQEVMRACAPGSWYMVADTRRTVATPRFEQLEPALARLGSLHVVPGGRPVLPDVLSRGGADVRAVLITDGVAELQPSSQMQTLSVFEPADNVGITAFELRSVPGADRRYQAFVELLNASPGAKRVELKVAGAGRPPAIRVLTIPGGGTTSETFDVSAFDGGPLRASIATQYDALASDDVAYAYLPANHILRVGVVASGDARLQRLLRLLPGVRVSAVLPQQVGSRTDMDAWVFEDYAPERAPGAPALMLRPRAVNWLPAREGELAATSVSSWLHGHPITEGLSLRDVSIDRALALTAPPGAQVLASDAGGRPLILASTSAPGWVEFAFALRDSTLPLQPAFPALLSNALQWLTAAPPALRSEPGLVSLPLFAAEVFDIHGLRVDTRAAPGATLIEVQEPGIYTAMAGDRRVRAVVSVTDAAVTAVNTIRLQADASALHASPSVVDPWQGILLAAALLLTLEWWTYNRRLTV